jgi:hypothetical protein
MSANLLNLPAALGALILKWATAKYIEAAGATSAEMLARAQSIKALATAADAVAVGAMSLAQLATATAADLAAAKVSVSNQILINGLLQLIGGSLPSGNLLTAALGAQANVFLQDVIAVCASFGA